MHFDLCTSERQRLINNSTLWSVWYRTANSPPSILSNVLWLCSLFVQSISTRDSTSVCFPSPISPHHPTAFDLMFSIRSKHVLLLHAFSMNLFNFKHMPYIDLLCYLWHERRTHFYRLPLEGASFHSEWCLDRKPNPFECITSFCCLHALDVWL